MAEQSAGGEPVARTAPAGHLRPSRTLKLDSREAPDERAPTQRSVVTNGNRLFLRRAGGNDQSAWARRLRDVVEMHVSDLGGWEACSAAEQSLIRRVAALTVELERLEARFSNSDHSPRDGDLQTYQRLTNTLRRALEAVGIHRRPRDVTPPTLDGYLGSLNRSKAEQNSETHSPGTQINGRE